MKVVENYQGKSIAHVSKTVLEDLITCYIKELLAPGQTVLMFSHGIDIGVEAIYLEKDYLQSNSTLEFPAGTCFINEKNLPAIGDFLNQVDCKNLLIVHHQRFKYQTVEVLNDIFSENIALMPDKCCLIGVVDMTFINFNRLTTSVPRLEHLLHGKLIGNNIVTHRIKNICNHN